MRNRVLLGLPLALLVACGARPAVPSTHPADGHLVPVAVASVRASAVPFAGCQPPPAEDQPPTAGLRWVPGTAVRKNLGCRMSFTTVPRGGSLAVSFEASATPRADVQDRLRELLATSRNPGVAPLPDLGVGTVAGGAAFTGGSGVRYLLYVGTATTVITVVCLVPLDGGPQAGSALQPVDREPQTSARELLRWVLAHQPAQG